MSTQHAGTPAGQVESWFEKANSERYVLCLFVAGMTARSCGAIDRIKHLCEKYLPERYELEIIDIYQQPGLAKEYQIFALPTLVKKAPAPARRLIGDLSHMDDVLRGLDLHPQHSLDN